MLTLLVFPGSGETSLMITEPATGAWYGAAKAGATATDAITAEAVNALSSDLRTILFIVSFHSCSHKQVVLANLSEPVH
jgi:hypothetical protein